MQKTRLGISVGFLGALMYFSGLVNGYLLAIIIGGYILIAEKNIWLKKPAIKTIAIMLICSLSVAVISLLPDVLSAILSLMAVFQKSFSIAAVNGIVSFITQVINLIEKCVLIVFGINALHQGNISIPVLDNFINKIFADYDMNNY